MADALSALSLQSGTPLLYEGDLAKNIRSPALQGASTADAALDKLLAGTGLECRRTGNGAIMVAKEESRPARQPAKDSENAAPALATVKVTGQAGYDSTDPYNPDYAVPNATTATKTDTPIMETPANIQVLPRSLLDDQQVIRLQDAVKNVAGVQSAFSAGNSYNIFTIRGFNTAPADTSNAASVYRKGVRLRGFPFPTANLQRIEVLKGPASILFGRIEPGGLINVVPKDALATHYYSLQQQFGSYDLYRTSADATGPLTAGGSLLYRANFEYLDSGCFRDGLFNRVLDITPNLTWNLGDHTTMEFEFEYRHQDGFWDWGLPALGNRPAKIPFSRYLGETSNDRFDRDDYVVDLDLNHRFDEDWTLTWKGTFIQSDQINTAIYGFGLNEATGDLSRFFSYYDYDRTHFYTALNLTGHFETFGLRRTLLSGFDYYEDKQSTIHPFDSPATSINTFNPVFNAAYQVTPLLNFFQNNEWYGVYLQDQIDLGDQIHILLGGRYDDTYSISYRTDAVNVRTRVRRNHGRVPPDGKRPMTLNVFVSVGAVIWALDCDSAL
ncbi:MAG: TonB-dependent siderophore receptor [Methylococcales bacterium]